MRYPKVPRILFCTASGAEEKAEVHNLHQARCTALGVCRHSSSGKEIIRAVPCLRQLTSSCSPGYCRASGTSHGRALQEEQSLAVCLQLPLATAGLQLLQDPSLGASHFPSFPIYPARMQLCWYGSAACQDHLFSYLCGNTMSRHHRFDLSCNRGCSQNSGNPLPI